ncbi:hypothetical protein FE257_010844 [Aspergillus nanangensis]|uniref:FAD-binding PCMH-type domain-containing protein n=1 Tax=Aspergillus nanangensis TaxID=2582783 RepID=A0AAD4GY19_ASPNN|nr:hypothetical protein FE257_010844 [Aspergillus nanangensis]
MARFTLLHLSLLAGAGLVSAASPLKDCLEPAISKVAFEGDILYQATAVKRYNLDIDLTPAAVTYPESAAEVAEVVRCAAQSGLHVQAISGGHSYGNYGLGGSSGAVVVNLENLQQFSMNTTTWQATIGSGTLLGDVTKQLSDNGGRAMSHGTCPQVGSGGHFTIGGLGPTSRQFGAALDHIVEVEVVLANSSIVRASATHNPDIFFAVKGAASGFAIVTEFVVRTEPEPGSAVKYSYSFDFSDTAARADLFAKWQAYVARPGLTRKLASTLTLLEHGIFITGTFFGTQEEYDSLKIGDEFPGANNASAVVFKDWVGLVTSWGEDVALELGGAIPSHFYSKSRAFTAESLLSNDEVHAMFQYLDNVNKGTLLWFAIFDFQGGAINDVPSHETAYAHRDALVWLQSYAINLFGEVSGTTVEFLERLNELTLAGNATDVPYAAYAGYVDPRLGQDGPAAYWGDNLPRLQRIKKEIDPNDVFHNPQSVKVAAA